MQVAAAALAIVGTLAQGAGEAQQLHDSAKADLANAHNALLQGAIDETEIRNQARVADGDAMVAMAQSGVAVGTGSAADLLVQSATNREMDVLSKRYGASQEASGLYKSAKQKNLAAGGVIFGTLVRAGGQALVSFGGGSKPSGGTPMPQPNGG